MNEAIKFQQRILENAIMQLTFIKDDAVPVEGVERRRAIGCDSSDSALAHRSIFVASILQEVGRTNHHI